jgi:hypothetical protein
MSRLLTAPSLVLGLGASLRIADGMSWDTLLRAGIVVTAALWLAAVAVTVWCVYAPGWERGASPQRGQPPSAGQLAAPTR